MSHAHAHDESSRREDGPTVYSQSEARRVAGVERIGANATADPAVDPTRTKTLRDAYARTIRARYRAIGTAARRLIGDEDFLDFESIEPADTAANRRAEGGSGHVTPGVRPPKTGLRGYRDGGFPDKPPIPTTPVPRTPDYDWPSRGARMRAFDEWLQNSLDDVVIGDGAWADDYIRYASGRGVVHANGRLQAAGYPDVDDVDLANAFNLPIHRDTLSTFYRRQYQLLRGVNQQIANDISRELSQAMLEGVSPYEAGRRIGNTATSIGVQRGTVIARTELVHAYNESALDRYTRILGSSGTLQAVLEFQTAGDNRVCPECETLEGAIYTVSEARNVLPVHPLCRCTWIPTPYSKRGSSSGSGSRRPRSSTISRSPPPRPVDAIVREQLARDVTDKTKIKHIENAITDNLSVDAESLRTLDPDRAAVIARSLEKLDDTDALSNVKTVGTMRSNARSVAYFQWDADGKRALRFNPSNFEADKVREHIESGWMVGDPDRPLESVIYHELGHSKHFEVLEDLAKERADESYRVIQSVIRGEIDGVEESSLTAHVSQYSTTDPAEAVAELYSLQALGEPLDDETLIALYARVHGPDPLDDDPLSANRAKRRESVTYPRTGPVGMASYDEDDLPEMLRGERDRTRESLERLADAYDPDGDRDDESDE